MAHTAHSQCANIKNNRQCTGVQAARVDRLAVMLQALLRRWVEGDRTGFEVHCPEDNAPFSLLYRASQIGKRPALESAAVVEAALLSHPPNSCCAQERARHWQCS